MYIVVRRTYTVVALVRSQCIEIGSMENVAKRTSEVSGHSVSKKKSIIDEGLKVLIK